MEPNESDRRRAVEALFEPGVRDWFNEWIRVGMALRLMPPLPITLEIRAREVVDLARAFAEHREQAAAEERAACAAIADSVASATTTPSWPIAIARRIRARGKL